MQRGAVAMTVLLATTAVAHAGPDSTGEVRGYAVPTLLIGGIGGPSHHDGMTEQGGTAVIGVRVSLGGMWRVAPAWRVRVGFAADLLVPLAVEDFSGGLYQRNAWAVGGLEAELERELASGWFAGGRASGEVGDSTTGQWITVGGRARKGNAFVGVDVILARQATDIGSSKGYGVLLAGGIEGRAGRYVVAAELAVAAILTVVVGTLSLGED